jgi:hypothetical protein
MPYTIENNRKRRRQIARIRQDSKGNYITIIISKTGYYVEFPPSPEHYRHYKLYPYAHPTPIGYIFEPPPKYPLKPLFAVSTLETIPTGEIAKPPTVETPTGIPPETAVIPTAPAVSTKQITGNLTPGTTPKTPFNFTMKVKRLTILAATTNTGTIWIGTTSAVWAGGGFPLIPGAAVDFGAIDMANIYIIAENTTDKVYYLAEI